MDGRCVPLPFLLICIDLTEKHLPLMCLQVFTTCSCLFCPCHQISLTAGPQDIMKVTLPTAKVDFDTVSTHTKPQGSKDRRRKQKRTISVNMNHFKHQLSSDDFNQVVLLEKSFVLVSKMCTAWTCQELPGSVAPCKHCRVCVCVCVCVCVVWVFGWVGVRACTSFE